MLEQDELQELLKLHDEGLSISAISRRLNRDRKTVYKYVRAGHHQIRYVRRSTRPTKLARFEEYLRNRIFLYPELTAARLLRELRTMGYAGSASILKERVRRLRASVEFLPTQLGNSAHGR